jgi:hypothetical protein
MMKGYSSGTAGSPSVEFEVYTESRKDTVGDARSASMKVKLVWLPLIGIVVLSGTVFRCRYAYHPVAYSSFAEIHVYAPGHELPKLDNYADLVREARNLHESRLATFEQEYGRAARMQLEAYELRVKAGTDDPCKGLSKTKCGVYEHNRQVLLSRNRSEWRQTDPQEEDRRKKSGSNDPVIWDGPEKFILP